MKQKRWKTDGYLRIFASYYRPHWKLFALDMVCALCICLVDLAFPIVSRFSMQTLLPGQMFTAFFVVMAVLAGAYVLKGCFYYIITYWGHLLGVRMEADIRRDLFSHMQDLSFSFYDKNRTGQLMSRVTGDLFEITELAHHGPEDLFISSITILGAFCVMLTIRWELALIVFAVIPLFILFTTLCQLIPRFYDVTEGRVLVDGKDVRTLTQHSLRANIGIVQQDVFLFAGTIYDNIRYGRPDATEAEIVEAAKRAEIYDDILDMPDGFQTQVGERGAMLSGGQKQRVSIARIFLKDPPVLILDEATSALDSVTEARIQSAFDELAKGRTTLIIAHRLSTIRSASRILVIDGNGIQEEGTHEELMAKGGEYAQLYLAQKSVSV